VVAVPAAFLLIALGAVPAAGDRTGGRSGRTLLLAVPSLVVAAAAVARNLLSLEVEGSTAGLSAGVGP
jgi:hypothetical protein